ncbi:flavodoxin family protein [Absicoccus intestinalis]|uniref:Flavodoxin-like domain-containing protein n=1 Tax=Absicoccus intestinalis TaxID=2926319 RepID=A0ABU4WKE3_9FIRM|nr:flavodoxin domain-containing protein [Absicoccus sp. CLA-KB-P134]MDX8417035.1 hypothetical protein [Absicoccus sp. CLA-KB-P134]
MNAVRYYSRSGNTKLVADAIAQAIGTTAISVDQADAKITQSIDTLFVGGALYAYGLDKHLKKYLNELDAKNVKKAVLFSTSWISKHSLDLMRKQLEEKGIKVVPETFYVKNKPSQAQLEQAKEFAKQCL